MTKKSINQSYEVKVGWRCVNINGMNINPVSSQHSKKNEKRNELGDGKSTLRFHNFFLLCSCKLCGKNINKNS
jgi:hypothetical protein